MQTKEPVIVVEDLVVAYGDHVVLDQVNFTVEPGEV